MTEKDKLLDHEYDGIQEYDNDLPIWWRNIFIVTTVFAVVYAIWTHSIKVPQHEELAAELRQLEALKNTASSVRDRAGSDAPSLMTLVKNPEVLQRGEDIFIGKCAACHGQNGEGLIGPNLTDDYWVHGATFEDIRSIVVRGVPEKGMLAWEALLKPKEINEVVAYVWSLHGTNPANAKAPEGELLPRDDIKE